MSSRFGISDKELAECRVCHGDGQIAVVDPAVMEFHYEPCWCTWHEPCDVKCRCSRGQR